MPGVAETGWGGRGMKTGLRIIGWLCALAVALQLGSAVFGWHRYPLRWLAAAPAEERAEPAWIVILGGGGIPSESGLMRTYYGAEWARQYPDAGVIVSLPTDFDPDTTSVGRMRDELTMRGVPKEVIRMETTALNTHEQAVAVQDMVDPNSAVWLVSSPTHMRRALSCFQKQGFTNVHGVKAYVTGAEADIGKGGLWRYQVWANLEVQARIAREGVALLVYKMRGWI